VALYQDLLKQHGDSPAVLNSLGANLFALQQTSDAIQAYRSAVSLAPEEIGYRLNLAHALESTGDGAGAVTEYRGVLSRNPENGMALRGLGMLLYRMGEPANALALLRQASERTPGGLDPEAAGVLQKLQQSPPEPRP
jgi:Flp pilus assembly protein TadD